MTCLFVASTDRGSITYNVNPQKQMLKGNYLCFFQLLVHLDHGSSHAVCPFNRGKWTAKLLTVLPPPLQPCVLLQMRGVRRRGLAGERKNNYELKQQPGLSISWRKKKLLAWFFLWVWSWQSVQIVAIRHIKVNLCGGKSNLDMHLARWFFLYSPRFGNVVFGCVSEMSGGKLCLWPDISLKWAEGINKPSGRTETGIKSVCHWPVWGSSPEPVSPPDQTEGWE